MNDVVTAALSLVVVGTPWVLGGFHPTREDVAWAILLAFAVAFLTLGAIVMSTFLHAGSAASIRRTPLP